MTEQNVIKIHKTECKLDGNVEIWSVNKKDYLPGVLEKAWQRRVPAGFYQQCRLYAHKHTVKYQL